MKIVNIKKYISILSKLLFASVILVAATNKSFANSDFGVTPLMQSVSSNDIEGVKFFAKVDPYSVNKQNIGGATALHIAARNGDENIVKILIRAGARTDIVDNDGYSPLMRAALYSHEKVIDILLLQNSNLSLVNKENESVIVQSAISQCNICMQSILNNIIPDQNFDIIQLKKQIKKAFSIASWKENQEQKKMLLNFYEKLEKSIIYKRKKVKARKPIRRKEDIYILQKPNIENHNSPMQKKLKKSEPNAEIIYKLYKPEPEFKEEMSEPIIKYTLIKGKEKSYKRNHRKKYKFKGKKANKKQRKPHKAKPRKKEVKNKPTQIIERDLNAGPQGKSLILDGTNVIMENNEIEKTFIIK